MTETIQKTHVRFDWKLAPDYRNARYYDVYAYPHSIPLLVLLGVTKGTNSDRIYPLNYLRFCELKTNHVAYDGEMSVEDYLKDSTFPFVISDSDMVEILEYLQQHDPKSVPVLSELWCDEEEG
jgi:hypothetical protein